MTKIRNKKLKKSSQEWMSRQLSDPFVIKRKTSGYRSRSAYKLLEIDQKFKIFKNDFKVIDIGASPGGWSQITKEKVKRGKVVAVDLNYMEEIPGVQFILGDFLSIKVQNNIKEFFGRKVDLVISDMAPNTTGNRNLDSLQTIELSMEAMSFSISILKENGIFITKFFMGSLFNELMVMAKRYFKKVNICKLNSSRKESRENYLVCKLIKNL